MRFTDENQSIFNMMYDLQAVSLEIKLTDVAVVIAASVLALA